MRRRKRIAAGSGEKKKCDKSGIYQEHQQIKLLILERSAKKKLQRKQNKNKSG